MPILNTVVHIWKAFEHRPQRQMRIFGFFTGIAAGVVSLFVLGEWQGMAFFVVLLALAFAVGLMAWPVVDTIDTGIEETDKTSKIQEIQKIEALLEMVLIPEGTFEMGSDRNDSMAYVDEFPRHMVEVSAFLMAISTVTREQYRAVIEAMPEQWRDDTSENLPANFISWLDAVQFCNALSVREGLETCYDIDGEQVEWNCEADGYRLPTEAEWEYAARAKSNTRWCFGDDESELERYGWYEKNSGSKVQQVKELLPNKFGLYDMHGNVWEWVWDRYGEYEPEQQNNPEGPDTGNKRCLRGGSAWNLARFLRSARRRRYEPGSSYESIGFRCVRAPAASLDSSIR